MQFALTQSELEMAVPPSSYPELDQVMRLYHPSQWNLFCTILAGDYARHNPVYLSICREYAAKQGSKTYWGSVLYRYNDIAEALKAVYEKRLRAALEEKKRTW